MGKNFHSKIQTLLTIKAPLSLNEIYSLGDQLVVGSDGDLKEEDFAKQKEEVKIDLVFPVTLQFHNKITWYSSILLHSSFICMYVII